MKKAQVFCKTENMIQNNIEQLLRKHPLIPVVTIHQLSEIDGIYAKLKEQGISCIEITLRTAVSWEAISMFKQRYGHEFQVGVGTLVSKEDIAKCVELQVDFMVSPGLTNSMIEAFETSGIPFLPGVSTPSEIISAMDLGWRCFKFFPADLFGGINALSTYGAIFSEVTFCPTGGVNAANYEEYLALENVISVGGSWLLK